MTWDIRSGKEQESFEFIIQEFAPRLAGLGIQPTEAWYTVYGDGPQVLAGGITRDRTTLDQILQGAEWRDLHTKLMDFAVNYTYKIVPHTGNFQL